MPSVKGLETWKHTEVMSSSEMLFFFYLNHNTSCVCVYDNCPLHLPAGVPFNEKPYNEDISCFQSQLILSFYYEDALKTSCIIIFKRK